MSSVGTALMSTASRHHTATNTNTGSSDSGGGRRVSAPYLPHHHEQQQQTGEPACDGGGATCSSTRSVFGSPRLRSSCHERLYSRRRDRCSAAVLSPQAAPLCVGDVIVNRHVVRSSAASSAEPAVMFRSSSSLELDQHATSGSSSHVSNGVYWPHGRHLPGSVQRPPRGGKLTATPVPGESSVLLRREFGSHGSIDVAGRGGRYYVTPASSASGAVDCDSVSSSCSAVLKDFRSLDPELTHGERCVDGRHSSASTSGDTARCSPTLRSCTTGAASSTTTTSSSSTAGGGGGVGRFQRLWETRERRASRKMSSVSCSAAAAATLSVSSCAVTTSSSSSDVPSIFRRLRGATAARDKACTTGVGSTSTESSGSDLQLEAECRQLERRRRRLLVHYDWPSLLASVASPANPASPHHPQLPSSSSSSSDAATASLSSAVRHNTATGASAAAAACSSSSSSSSSQQETHPAASTTSENDVQSWHNSSPSNVDGGDGRSNELVESCAFFRNELGGERERCVSLMPQSLSSLSSQRHHIHRPAAACYLSVLEQPHSLTVWPVQQCPFSRASQPLLETASLGAFYYKDFFHAKPHENWLGVDDIVGPVCISVRRDRVVSPTNDLSDEVTDRSRQVASHSCFRVIIRCSQLSAVRGLLLEESVVQMSGSGSGGKSSSSSNSSSSNSSSSSKHQRLPVREILDHVAPNINTSCLRLATQDVRTEDYIMKLDEQNVSTRYKVGVMYCRAGQCTEEQMYSNETAGPAFNEFLEMIGQRVRLRGFDKYKAGLDNKSDTTGQYSVYTLYQGNEIMFHVSTMLQYCPNNRQQLLRKRYIGNDIVTLIFQEPGAAPFSPKYIRSQFQHVFIVVRAINPCSGPHTKYRVAVNRFHSVPAFGPPLSESAVYSKGKQLADLICAKVINAENAAFRSEKFMTMACRTRQEYLKDLAANYATDNSLDQQQKFSLMSFSGRKKERPRVRFLPDICQRGAIAWPVLVDEHGSNNQLSCVLGISADAVVLADESAGDLVFAAPSCSILAWSLHANSLRVFYHRGECVILYPRSQADTAELAEIAARLAVVSHAAETQELMLRRNVMGQLGLHVQQDGVVSEVEPNSSAWQQGLRPAARIVQICKVAVCSMTYEQMVDLLKTSPMVTVCVVPPDSLDNCSVRLGCTMAACGRVSPPPPVVAPPSNTTTRCLHMPPQQQQQQQHCPSPAGSSGYVTAAGSGGDGAPLRARGSSDTSGTLSSTCSSSSSSCGGHGVSSRHQVRGNGGLTPPPLPCRLRQTGGTVTSSSVVAGDHVPSHHLSHQDITHSSDRFSTVQSVGSGLVDQTNSLSLSSCLSSSVSRHITSSRLTKWPPPPSTSSSAAGISACQSHDNLNMLSCDPAPLQHHHDQVEAVSGASVSQLTSMLQQRISSTSSSSTSSASCTSSRRDTAGNNVSALQKELLRLISPSPPLPAVVSSCSSDLVDDVIITAAARPAVSVTPAPSGGGADNHTHTENVQIDWRRLVQLAEEAGDTHDISRPNGKLTDTRSLLSCHSSPVQNNNNNNISGSLSDRVTTTLKAQQQLMNMHVSPSIRDDCQLRDRIASLQHELVSEQDRRQSLEHQVRQLSKDNRRLQDESRQAAQQLRKFTEWFFANFEKS